MLLVVTLICSPTEAVSEQEDVGVVERSIGRQGLKAVTTDSDTRTR